jgi:hypothetical protein
MYSTSSTDEDDQDEGGDRSYSHDSDSADDSDSAYDEHENDRQSGPPAPTREQQQQQQQDSLLSSTTNASSEDDDGDSPDELNLNCLSSHEQSQEVEGIALLRQIFPDETTEELRRLHQMHIQQGTTTTTSTSNNQQRSSSRLEYDMASQPKSPLGRRLWKQSLNQQQQQQQQQQQPSSSSPSSSSPVNNEPPADFLRLPTSVAVRRYHEAEECWRYELLDDLQQRALEQHTHYVATTNNNNNNDPVSDSDSYVYTATIVRHADVGLGMTLYQDDDDYAHHIIQVHSLTTTRDRTQLMGPSFLAGVQPGDVLIGVNGQAFRQSIDPQKLPLLQHAVNIIHLSPDPIVLHLQRQRQQQQPSPTVHLNLNSNEHPMSPTNTNTMTTPKSIVETPSFVPSVERSTSLLDATTDTPDDDEREAASSNARDILSPYPAEPNIHPFAKALRGRALLHSQNGKSVNKSCRVQYYHGGDTVFVGEYCTHVFSRHFQSGLL